MSESFSGMEPVPASPAAAERDIYAAAPPPNDAADGGSGTPARAMHRVPHLGHTSVFFITALLALVACQLSFYALALVRHLFPRDTAQQLQHEPLIIVPAEGFAYLLTLGVSALIFRAWWKRSFATGIEWNGREALRRIGWLIPAGLLLGLLLEWISSFLPVPKQMPLDQFFRTPAAVWAATILGIFIAPAFEEVAFRGFLLPSIERVAGRAISVVITSLLFAGLHASQLGKAWAPLVIIFFVSVILCLVRIRYRSVAASTLVHAAYNASIFVLVFIGTDGYRHLEKMKH